MLLFIGILAAVILGGIAGGVLVFVLIGRAVTEAVGSRLW